ncbi:hypothetical protein Micbo1qcDRAFT_158863 [Microdochium bolleyi]|uniref:Putative zinc-finger domain-containing protein n=1 Tax=Microdochium bolleyi TaxID=196109 RepID=A0A136J9X5_9PEZI|nr:hypothetical protein Micbo1qcDRAFT_158863 [Microdochium bolleyi]
MARNDNAPMIAEAKKKAQEAILALWPLKVRYQNYIDEGFDENVVNALFKELGLATPATKSTQPAARRASGVSEVASSSNGAANTNNAKDGGVSGKPRVNKVSGQDPLSEGHVSEDKQPQLRSAKSAAEERKDKIARKLAAKAQKPSTTMAVSEPPVAKVAVAATAKVKTRAETNALLHQKLAALKKTQEKAAADRLAATAAVAVKDETASEPLQSADKGHPLNPTPPIPTLPLAGQSSEPTREAQSKTTAESLARSIMPATESVRALKRPVASDFDNYPSYLDGSLKRTRTQDTLIIDVSDEDEDDDVEMEIGSPTDEQEDYASSHNDNTPATTGGLHMTQSGEAVAQPAAERASTAPAPEGRGKLHLLRGKIEEMRRRIAEAEAKKTGKTPVQTEPSSPQSPSMPSNAMGLALPKLSKLRREPQQQNHVRDGRVMSVELLLVESDLRAKQEKLKTIVAEAARLELEIQDALAQKQKLSSEMEHFDNNAGSEPNTASRLQSPVEDAAPTRQPLSSESTNIQQNDLEQAQKASTNPATVSAGIEATSNTDVVELYQDEPNQHESQRSSISTHQDAEPSTEEAASHSSQGGPTSMEISTEEDRDGTDEDDDISMSADDDDSEDSDSDQSMEAAVEAGPLIEPVPEDETSTSPKDHDAAQVKVTSVNKTQGYDAAAACPSSSSATETLKDNAAVEPDDVRNLEAQQVAIQEDSEQQSVNIATANFPYPYSKERLTATQVNDHVDDATESFSSYHSPLGYFRAYRFHPTFLDKVPGGLKSLTYSSKIDVEQMLCPSESDGQECPDPECEYQHFRKMVLPDGDIITQLGSADMFSGETKIQFIAGLRKTLQELKVNKVKDFDRITKAIVQYRADFLADKSKILPLNGVQL